MHIKKIIILIFSLLSFVFFTNKVSAITIAQCDYGEEKLLLPVTVGIEVNAIDLFYPFDRLKDINYTEELFVYNEETCSASFYEPKNTYNYYYTYSYYYKYNEKTTYVNYLGNGSYSEVDLTPPTISSSLGDTITVNVNKPMELDAISGFIHAKDDREGAVIPEITFDNYSDNYNKVGQYSIIFKACDSSNNCTSFILKMKVVDTTPPIISGNTNVISYMSDPLLINDLAKTLTAIDNHDGDISSKIILTSNNYNYEKEGNYYAYFYVEDSSKNAITTNYKVLINVVDDIPPTIEGPTIFNSNLSSPLQLNDIISQFVISDNVDTNAYQKMYIISDTYSNNKGKTGSYNIVIGAYDSNGNESIPYIVEVIVTDDVVPIIDGNSFYESYLSSPISLLEIKANLIVYDNYDGNLFNKLEIIEDSYTLNKNNIGIFYIGFIVNDSSNNTSSPFIVEIHVYDDVLPIIEGTNTYNVLTSEKLDLVSIKLNLTARDNVDGDISNDIVLNEDFYTNNYNIQGSYFVTFYVCDKSGNISTMFRVKITVSEEISFLDSINNSYLYFDTTTLNKDEDIYEILSIDTSNYNSISTLENSYINNYNVEGQYKIIYQFENTDYSTSTLSINIITKDISSNKKNNSTQEVKENKKETIFNKIISFFSKIFANIGSYFKNLFN